MPDLPRAVELAVGIPDRVDLDAQGGIRLGPGRCAVRIMRNGTPVIIGGWGKLQCSANWLDPEGFLAFLNESNHLRNGRSSSAGAKYAFASGLEPVAPSLAHPSSVSHWPDEVRALLAQARSPLGSNQWRLNGSLRAISALVGPGRSPPSRWTCRIQTRRLSGERPNLPAIAVNAAASL